MRYVCPECGDGADGPGACAADASERAAVGSDTLLGTTIGSWRVARLLGAGGMGRVYVAVQPKIGARVAIKVLKGEISSDPDVVERFFNEARAVNLIKHEAIVDVIDLGQLPDGAPYIVMEYLDGASLGAILRARTALPLRTAARIVGEVLAALEAVHAKGIIHRDLKPDNIFISPSGRVTVLDFGVAKLVNTEGLGSTQTGSLLGTPAYMSPEQARSQPLDARSDLYAVGVILYEATTRQLPFVAANVFDLLQMHVAQPPRPPRELMPEMPEVLEAVILRALSKAPGDRFGSASEMRQALERSVETLPQTEVAAIVLPREGASAKQKLSDPFAQTAASDSIATDRTQAAPQTAPGASRRSRPSPTRYLVAGGGLALVVGSAAVIVHSSKREPRTPVVIETARVDAGPPMWLIPQHPGPFAVPHADAFDPVVYYQLTATRAAALGGTSTRMTVMRVHEMNREGIVDLTSSGQVEIIFASPERARAGEPCYIEFDFGNGKGDFELGHQAETDHCDGGVYPPRCTLKQISERATAKGMPANADKITLNKFPEFWQVSTWGDPKFSEAIDDDCP